MTANLIDAPFPESLQKYTILPILIYINILYDFQSFLSTVMRKKFLKVTQMQKEKTDTILSEEKKCIRFARLPFWEEPVPGSVPEHTIPPTA